MLRSALLLLCASFSLLAFSQEPKFIQHDLGEVNIGITVNVVFQDSQGMIWLGTNKGLGRYDGTTWYDIPLIKDSIVNVTAIGEDLQSQIWVGDENGDIFYLDKARHVHPFEIEEGNPKKKISGIGVDSLGQLWIATYGEGLYVYTGERLYLFDEADKLSSKEIYCMTITPDGKVWIGTDNGINICHFQDEKKEVRSLNLPDGLPDQIITALKCDLRGNVFIGTSEQGVAYYDRQTKKISTLFPNAIFDQITSLELFDQRELWIGTRTKGVWRYPLGAAFAERVMNLKKYEDRVNAILLDYEGNIWVAISEIGLLSAFRPFELLTGQVGQIQALHCDEEGQVWIGSENGLYRLDENQAFPSAMVPAEGGMAVNVTSIIEDKYHHLWIATLDKGLLIYDKQKKKLIPVSRFPKELANTMPLAISREYIWIAMNDGVYTYPTQKDILKEPQYFQSFHSAYDSSLLFVFDIYVDSKDRTWFATDGEGVYAYDQGHMSRFVGNDTIRLLHAYSISEDTLGHMWFITPDYGLVQFNGIDYAALGVKEGLGHVEILSMVSAGTGDMIMAHNGGIDLMQPARGHFIYYKDEIGAREFEPGTNAITLDGDNNVYVGGRDALFKYFATKYPLSFDPNTQITKVTVFDNPIDFINQHTFSHSQNFFTFEYVGLWYTSPSSVNYEYKLENYDLGWKQSRDNKASYSELSPGTYTFYVKASENKGFYNEPLTSYTFTIKKPFFLKAWFLLLVAIAIIGLIALLIKSRERRSERQAMLKKEMVESQLSTLKAQINPHFLFNSFNTLITIIDENAKDPNVAIEYVEKLSDFYRSILQYREQETISLEEEFELVRNFTYLLQKRYGHYLRLHLDPVPKDGYILPLTLQILVENAVKHNVITEKKPLDVYIKIEEDNYVAVINTLQPKSKSDPSTQFGLGSIIKRYQLLSERKVLVTDGPQIFKVSIPIIKRNL